MSDLHEIYEELNGSRFHRFCRINPTAKVHDSSDVFDFANILADVEIAHCCSIGSGTELGRGTKVGAYTRIGQGCFFPPNSRIGRQVFVGPGVYCADDKHPYVHVQGEDPPYNPQPPVIDDGAVIGIGAVLLPGVHIGEGAIVAAGTVVTKDVPPYITVKGPAGKQHVLSEIAVSMFRGKAGVAD